MLLLLFGYGLAGILLPRSMRERSLQAGLAFPTLAGFACTLMIVHMGTGGALFASVALTRIVTGATVGLVVAVRLVRSRRDRTEADVPLYVPLVLVAASWALWGGPLFSMVPVGHIGNQLLHMGWTAQLMNGAVTPTSGLEGDIPNYYPWLFHALLAWITRLTPGGRAFHGQGPFLMMQLAGSVLTLYAIGRQIGGAPGGAAAALLGGLSGGFGWLRAQGAALVFDPRAEGGQAAGEYLGDLLYRRPYNSSFHNLVPVFPRDSAYVLLGGFLLLAVVGLARDSDKDRLLIGSGLVLGLVGVTGGETFLVGIATAVGIALCDNRGRRLRTMACVLFPAGMVSCLWLLPLGVNYYRLGGFVNTASQPITLSPVWILNA